MGTMRILWLKRKFDAVSRMTPEEVEKLQQKNIRATLNNAVRHSPFYKKLYKGKSADELMKEGFSSLPTVGKRAIMDNFNEVITNPILDRHKLEHYMATKPVGGWYARKYKVIHSSGSSGTIGIFAYDDLGWDKLKACAMSRTVHFKVFTKIEKLAFTGATDGHYAGVTLASDVPTLVAAAKNFSVNMPMEEMVNGLNKFQPTRLSGYPSGLTILANEQLAGKLKIKPVSITSSGEPLDEGTRHLLREAFGIPPHNFYAASESVCLAQECEEHKGLHTFPDQNVIEVVDKDFQPVEPGKKGKVLLTNLYNSALPLIRYTMKDTAEYSEELCECGSPLPTLKNVYGREEESIWVEDYKGKYDILHSAMFVEFFVPGLKRIQIVQKARNKLLLRIVTQNNDDKIAMEARLRLNEILSAKKLHHAVETEVERVDSIPPDPKTGKTKIVVAMKPPKGVL
jgi:phenylacetate-coenzyme A ligase PaaK-like adenylate-forming protein